MHTYTRARTHLRTLIHAGAQFDDDDGRCRAIVEPEPWCPIARWSHALAPNRKQGEGGTEATAKRAQPEQSMRALCDITKSSFSDLCILKYFLRGQPVFLPSVEFTDRLLRFFDFLIRQYFPIVVNTGPAAGSLSLTYLYGGPALANFTCDTLI